MNPAMNQDTALKAQFDLDYSNLQSISRAQRFYLSGLLVYLCLVWAWSFMGAPGVVSIQVLGAQMKLTGFWTITPFVTTLLALALIGAINAAGPAWARFRKTAAQLQVEAGVCNLVFYNFDSHKNIFDYYTFLTLHPEREPEVDRRRRFDWRHLLYPSLLCLSIYTTYKAIGGAYGIAEATGHGGFQVYGWTCLAFQVLYAVRLFWRYLCRFLGVRLDKVSYM